MSSAGLLRAGAVAGFLEVVHACLADDHQLTAGKDGYAGHSNHGDVTYRQRGNC